jgi:hypothetical protein
VLQIEAVVECLNEQGARFVIPGHEGFVRILRKFKNRTMEGHSIGQATVKHFLSDLTKSFSNGKVARDVRSGYPVGSSRR